VRTVTAPKKVSAAAFSADGRHVFLADRFGDVLVARVAGGPGPVRGAPLLGHFSAVVTSLAPSPDGGLLVSADRESKVRVSRLPADPMQGSWEVQAYCLGHTSFVTSAAMGPPGAGWLATGGGDGTVKLWEYATGRLLDSYQAAAPRLLPADAAAAADAGGDDTGGGDDAAGGSGSGDDEGAAAGGGGGGDGGDGGGAPGGCSILQRGECDAVLCVAACAGAVAAVVEGDTAVHLLSVTPSGPGGALRLALRQRLSAAGHVSSPCRVALDAGGGLLALGGPMVRTSAAAHLAAAAPTPSGAYAWDASDAALGGAAARAALEARDAAEEAALAAAEAAGGGGAAGGGPDADAGGGSYSGHLKKKDYTVEEMNARKKARKDLLEGVRLASLRAGDDASAAAAAAAAGAAAGGAAAGRQ
jgi:tRNA (guanine-N(7)-)-methyltransferase subunit TRM82